MLNIQIFKNEDFPSYEIHSLPIEVLKKAYDFAHGRYEKGNITVKIYPDRAGQNNNWILAFSSFDEVEKYLRPWYVIEAIENGPDENHDGPWYSFHS